MKRSWWKVLCYSIICPPSYRTLPHDRGAGFLDGMAQDACGRAAKGVAFFVESAKLFV